MSVLTNLLNLTEILTEIRTNWTTDLMRKINAYSKNSKRGNHHRNIKTTSARVDKVMRFCLGSHESESSKLPVCFPNQHSSVGRNSPPEKNVRFCFINKKAERWKPRDLLASLWLVQARTGWNLIPLVDCMYHPWSAHSPAIKLVPLRTSDLHKI